MDEDIKSQIKRMNDLHTKLAIELEEVLKKSGRQKQELQVFCQNPSNFSKDLWEKMQSSKEEMESKLVGLSSDELKKKKVQHVVTTAAKERRGKTLGSRKHWLDMR